MVPQKKMFLFIKRYHCKWPNKNSSFHFLWSLGITLPILTKKTPSDHKNPTQEMHILMITRNKFWFFKHKCGGEKWHVIVFSALWKCLQGTHCNDHLNLKLSFLKSRRIRVNEISLSDMILRFIYKNHKRVGTIII